MTAPARRQDLPDLPPLIHQALLNPLLREEDLLSLCDASRQYSFGGVGASLIHLQTIRQRLGGSGPVKLIAAVAPRLATALGQKLAAQSVPVLGAVAGATTNMVYTRYYQEVAHVHFGLRRLAINANIPPAQVLEQFRKRMQRPARRS